MIDLGSTDFFIDVPSLPRAEFEEYSTRLFDEWVAYVDKYLDFPDYSLSLEIEEGSVKGKGKVALLLGTLYFGIGNYGDFISGLQTIRSQVGAVGDFLAAQAVKPFESQGHAVKVKRHGGALGQLQRLFNKVQSREFTAEEAMQEATLLLGEEAKTNPEFMRELEEALSKAPKFHEQLPLIDTTEQDSELQLDEKKEKPSRSPRPIPIAPPRNQFRVEVWRESKNSQRKMRIVQL
ncbi:hypothetical protein [Gallionella capsiferriformans]|uniref:Uncharacterized protein n=1 Tax=Gallionella capsiferriformans (strain ES-2) TaxID=395494 RepID=D9SG69_GALCS|nr:hypothetical protein [Gallionella capsiferriformans]ADL55516.1 hypothetical protein Galf_1497 [Gallionella capsiferriformans ES-2]